ncbi:MAG: DegQ family serine endoprotease [Pseudomonadota bacterium]
MHKSGLLTALLVALAPAIGWAQDTAPREVPQNQAQIQLSFAPVVARTSPAVVNIFTARTVQVADPFFRFFMDRAVTREQVQRSLGSGVVLAANGIVVTNNHVVGDADEIRVVLADRREFEARLLLADERTDLAVLKIDAKGEALPALELANADDLQVGDLVIAIGNPFGVGQTVTSGIVSALARTGVGVSDYQSFIQTDAAINPGNSGGALIDLKGRLVGINTAIFTRTGGSLGIGFAIPADMVRVVLEAATSDRRVVRPWLGVEGQPVTSDIAASLGLVRPEGVLVDQVFAGSPAADAGLAPGDVITRVAGREVADQGSLRYRLATQPIGATVPITVVRGGAEQVLRVRLKAPPEIPPREVTELSGRNALTGVTVGNLSPAFAEELGLPGSEKGVIVLDVDPRSPARRLNLFARGDILLEINGVAIASVGQLKQFLADTEPVDMIYRIKRRGREALCQFRAPGSLACRS